MKPCCRPINKLYAKIVSFCEIVKRGEILFFYLFEVCAAFCLFYRDALWLIVIVDIADEALYIYKVLPYKFGLSDKTS